MPQLIVVALFGSAFAGTIAGQIITGIIGIGLSAGLQLLTQALFGQDAPKPEDLQGLIRQSVSQRWRHYGDVRTGGALAFIEVASGKLYQVILHGEGPIDGYEEEVYIDNRLVSLDVDGGVTTEPYAPSHHTITAVNGVLSQTSSPILIAAFPEIWGPDHKIRGVAYSLFQALTVSADDVAEIYPNRIPVLNRVLRGVQCLDPRTSTTAYTRNFALHVRDYCTHADGVNLDSSLIDDDTFKIAADDCDDPITTQDGTIIKRYEGGLSYSFDEEPAGVLNRFIRVTDGRLFLTGAGKIGFQVGKWRTPTKTIDDSLGHILTYELTSDGDPFELVNYLTVKFTHTGVGYKQAESDPWVDQASIDTYGRAPNVLEAFEIRHHNHARRIAKILTHRANPRWRGTIITKLIGLDIWDERWVRFKIPLLEIDEYFEIVGPPGFDADENTVTFEVMSFDGNVVYAFNPATEEGEAPTVPEELEEEEIPEPTDVVAELLARVTGQTTSQVWDPDTETNNPEIEDVSYFFGRIRWAAAPREGLIPQAGFTINGGIDWSAIATSEDSVSADTPPMAQGDEILMRVRYRTIGGAPSEYVYGSPLEVPTP